MIGLNCSATHEPWPHHGRTDSASADPAHRQKEQFRVEIAGRLELEGRACGISTSTP
jgi:hypothetical protein